VTLRGRIDRVDIRGGEALVRDYKSGKNAYPVARWEQDNRLQAAIYMIAVREQLGLEPVGGVYVPLAAPKGKDKPRGLLLKEEDGFGEGFAPTDMRDREQFDAELTRARERVCEIAGQIREGDVKPCPESCAWNGGCSFPSICRVEKS
jgi:ATP-dependent helicase/DNAse subunit B